jgi:O-antigen ligase
MALAHPLAGVGPDNFRLLYADYGEDVWREPDLAHPHNVILDTWLRAGLLGLAGYLLLLALALRAAWRRARWATGWERALGAGAFGALAAALAHGLVDRDYFAVDLALAFWLLWALVRED